MKSNRWKSNHATRPANPFGASVGNQLSNPLIPSANAAAGLERTRLENLDLRRRPVAMRSLIEQCVEAMGPFVSGRGQRLAVSIAKETMQLDADAVRLGQVLKHLMINGTRFSATGTTVAVRAFRDANDAVVVISDSGVGIDAQRIHEIFAVYLQRHATNPQRQGRLGIGLHIARALAEAHGGSLTALSSGVGHGSAFTLRLPCVEHVAAPVPAPQVRPSNRSVSALTAA